MNADPWVCPECGNENDGLQSVCLICSYDRESSLLIAELDDIEIKDVGQGEPLLSTDQDITYLSAVLISIGLAASTGLFLETFDQLFISMQKEWGGQAGPVHLLTLVVLPIVAGAAFGFLVPTDKKVITRIGAALLGSGAGPLFAILSLSRGKILLQIDPYNPYSWGEYLEPAIYFGLCLVPAGFVLGGVSGSIVTHFSTGERRQRGRIYMLYGILLTVVFCSIFWIGFVFLSGSGSELPSHALRGHKDDIISLAFSPDGQTLISADSGGKILWWDLNQDQIQAELLAAQVEWTCSNCTSSISLDGRLLAVYDASSSDGTIRLWDLANRQAMPAAWLTIDHYRRRQIAISPDGHWLASTADSGLVYLYDLNDLSGDPVILKIQDHVPDHYTSELLFSPDGRWLAMLGNTILVWDMERLENSPPHIARSGYAIFDAGFWPNKPRLVWTEGGRVNVLEVPGGPINNILQGPISGIAHSMAMSLDGQRLALCWRTGSIFVYDLDDTEAEPLAIPGISQGCSPLIFSPDGRFLGSARGDTIWLWELEQ